jgi:hypothetical protein
MTLIELSIAIMIAMTLAVASMAMLSQQLSFTRMVQNQTFLLEDCPSINNTLSRMLGRVDSYRIYPDVDGAKAGGAAVLTGGKALLLSYRDSLERVNRVIVAAEDIDPGQVRLGVYVFNGTSWGTSPDWIISTEAADAEFFVENGVLRVRLTGPNDEEITYSGHTQS